MIREVHVCAPVSVPLSHLFLLPATHRLSIETFVDVIKFFFPKERGIDTSPAVHKGRESPGRAVPCSFCLSVVQASRWFAPNFQPFAESVRKTISHQGAVVGLEIIFQWEERQNFPKCSRWLKTDADKVALKGFSQENRCWVLCPGRPERTPTLRSEIRGGDIWHGCVMLGRPQDALC